MGYGERFLGERVGVPHETLYWRYKAWSQKPEQDGWAIREGDWMLVRNGWGKTPPALYNVANDPMQKTDLSQAQPERFSNLRKKWEAWDRHNVSPGSLP